MRMVKAILRTIGVFFCDKLIFNGWRTLNGQWNTNAFLAYCIVYTVETLAQYSVGNETFFYSTSLLGPRAYDG